MSKKSKLVSKLKCAWYYYWLISVSTVRELRLGKNDAEEKSIEQAWKNKDEQFLRQALSKQWKDRLLTILFLIGLFFSVAFHPHNSWWMKAVKIANSISLVTILVLSPLIFLWKALRDNDTTLLNQPWNSTVSATLVRLLLQEGCEEQIGGIREARYKLLDQGDYQWVVSLLTLWRIFLLVVSVWLSKFVMVISSLRIK